LTISSFSPFNEKLRFLGSLPLEKTIALLLSSLFSHIRYDYLDLGLVFPLGNSKLV
jgi:hypothetical protein